MSGLLEGVARVGYELADEDLAVSIQRVGDYVKQLPGLGLKPVALLLSHDRFVPFDVLRCRFSRVTRVLPVCLLLLFGLLRLSIG
eukprot:755157-Hanusia_phi.AAC.4